MNYFEQFVGDDPLDYGQVEMRLVYMPTGEYILFNDDNFYKHAQMLWAKVGSPQMWLGSFISSTAIEEWVDGILMRRTEQ